MVGGRPPLAGEEPAVRLDVHQGRSVKTVQPPHQQCRFLHAFQPHQAGRDRIGPRRRPQGKGAAGDRADARPLRHQVAPGLMHPVKQFDLLEPVEKRPKTFYRGYDVYNQVKVGFVTSPAEAELVGMRCEVLQDKKLCEVERIGTPYDVGQRGSGNQGHLYGTDLSPKDKDALVEYMKTL